MAAFWNFRSTQAAASVTAPWEPRPKIPGDGTAAAGGNGVKGEGLGGRISKAWHASIASEGAENHTFCTRFGLKTLTKWLSAYCAAIYKCVKILNEG